MNRLFLLLFWAVSLVAHAQVPDYVPTEGLVAWYEFNASPNDESNSNFNLCADSLTYTSDRWGATEGAYLSTYGGDLLSACDPSGIWSNSISYSLWFNPYDLTSDPYPSDWFALITMNGWNGESFGTIISKYGGGGECSAEELRIRPNWPSNQDFYTCEEIQEDHWYHLCVTGNEDSTNVFLNGDLIATSLHSSEAYFANVPFEWTIGASALHHTYHFKGAIDDVGIWNRALTEAEISALYNSELPVPGCTDSTACNFDEEANEDNGSCIPSGCMEPEACNYNALAECEGEACDYACCPGPGCCSVGMFWDYELEQCMNYETCQEDLDGDGVIGINDLMELLSSFGTMCEEPETVEFTCGDPMNYHGYDYATVQIGEQCWFAENLRGESYSDGEAIPTDLSDSEWAGTAEGAVSVYDGDMANLSAYGRLYNWYAVEDSRGLCPSGWHIPSDGEFIMLELELGMSEDETNGLGWRGTNQGIQLKSNFGWWAGGNGDDSIGFTALPGGNRLPSGGYNAALTDGNWWTSSSSESQDGQRMERNLDYNRDNIGRGNQPSNFGFSIRCIKD